MLDLTLDQLTTFTALVGAVALVCLLTVIALMLRLRALRRDYAILRGEGNERDVMAAVARFAKKTDALGRRIEEVAGNLERNSMLDKLAIQKFHIVRYDAFEEMGGRLSFSAAFLDDHGDGLVLTSINGRTETRTYAKGVKAFKSEHNLSDEEAAAIEGAAGDSARSVANPASSSAS